MGRAAHLGVELPVQGPIQIGAPADLIGLTRERADLRRYEAQGQYDIGFGTFGGKLRDDRLAFGEQPEEVPNFIDFRKERTASNLRTDINEHLQRQTPTST